MRKIILKNLHLDQFKNHVSLDINFGVLNTIRGKNGTGKSSIGDGVSWCLSGLDILGSKLDPQPTDRTVDKVSVSIIFDVDGKEIKFTRELVKGKAAFYINDVPKKATEYNEVVNSLTGAPDIDLFLSLFNPSYFPSMHYTDQRRMFLSYVSAPANTEVFKTLPTLQSDRLKVAFKKNNIEDLENIHKKQKTNKERELIAAKSRADTLKGQLEGVEVQDLAKLQVELKEVETWLMAAEEIRKENVKQTSALITKERELNHIMQQIEAVKTEHSKVKNQDVCVSCGQKVTEEKKKEVCAGLNANRYKPLKIRYDELKKELAEMIIPIDNMEKVTELSFIASRLYHEIISEQNRLKAVETIEAAEQAVTDVQNALNESIFILDSIKAFKGAESVLQVAKVQSLFTTLSVKLWDVPKSGEPKPTFEIEMDGKPYSKLSLGEKARAGLELIAVLSQQSETLAPTFIDNAESITSQFPVELQSIAAYAVPDQKLLVEVDQYKTDNPQEDLITVDCEVIE